MTLEEEAIYFRTLFEEEREKNRQLTDVLVQLSGLPFVDAVKTTEQSVAIGGDPSHQVVGHGKVGWSKLKGRLEERYRASKLGPSLIPKEEKENETPELA